jgi:acyltransferase
VRLRFLDVARCLAIVLMVAAHVRDFLLSAEASAHPLARLHEHARGFTAPLFFVVSGWAFAAATLPRWRSFTPRSPELMRRLKRIALLFVTGKLLTLPWWAEGFPFDVAPEHWRACATSGVLECIAVSMLLAHFALVALREVRPLLLALSALTTVAIFAAPTLQTAAASWPAPFAGLLNADGFSGGFPLAPFGAYFWVGVIAGGCAQALGPRVTALAAASCFALFGLGAAPAMAMAIEAPRAGVASAGLFFTRCAVAFAAVGLLACIRMPSLPALERLADRALTFYVAHMLLLWGVPFVPGLVHRLANQLDTFGVVLVTLGMLTGIGVMCLLADEVAAWRGTRIARVRPGGA